MKTRPLFLALGMLAFTAFSLPSAQAEPSTLQKANAAFVTAIAHETAGEVDQAKRAYEQALRLNPRHAKARYRLGQLRINRDKIITKAKERETSTVMIPEYRVSDASLGDALKALAIHTEKASKQTVAPNFIIQDATGTLSASKVTLVMKNAPSGEILNYLLQMAKAQARYDKHAVVIMRR